MDLRYYEGTPLERANSRGDDELAAWARYEAKSEAMEAELRAQAGLGDMRAPARGSKLARAGAALVAYGLIAAIVLGVLSLSLRSTSQELDRVLAPRAEMRQSGGVSTAPLQPLSSTTRPCTPAI